MKTASVSHENVFPAAVTGIDWRGNAASVSIDLMLLNATGMPAFSSAEKGEKSGRTPQALHAFADLDIARDCI
jgi:hypothetical protein